MVVDKLVGPLHFAKIVQEFRSHINVRSVSASGFKDLVITDIEYSAFATQYFFQLSYEVVDDGKVTSSFLDVSGVKSKGPSITTYDYVGYLKEYIELDDPEKNKFEVQFVLKTGGINGPALIDIDPS